MLTASCLCGFTVEDETRDGIMGQMTQHAQQVHPDEFAKMSPEEREKKLDEIIKEKA
ncbi:DUF1059 domain-containing protein [Patescibacteria group bacterium]|nr:DUF1059 domain-containing protein [Patescibacteria group bacterium]